MSKLTILAIIFTTYFCLLSLPQAYADYESDFFGPKLVIRAPRSDYQHLPAIFWRTTKANGKLSVTSEPCDLVYFDFWAAWLEGPVWEKLPPQLLLQSQRNSGPGFQGTAQAQQPYDVAAASYYPSYMPGSYHGLPYSSGYGSFGGYHPLTSSFASYPGLDYGGMASAASLYPGFTPYSSSLSGSSGIDYQSYLDSLSGSSSMVGGRGGVGGGVGSPSSPTSSSSVASSSSSASGVSSSGSSSSDQDTSASSLSVKGDYPSSISLKSLYSSFPFAFTPEASSLDWHVPFARKHGLRRMSADKSNAAYQLQKLMGQSNQQQSLKQKERYYKEQDQIRNMLMNPQEYIAQIIQQELASQQAQLQSGVSARSTPDNQPAASSVSASVSSSSSPNFQSQSNYYYTSSQASGKPRTNLSASASSTSQTVSRKGSGLSSNQVSAYDRSSSSESSGSGKSSLRARSYSESS